VFASFQRLFKGPVRWGVASGLAAATLAAACGGGILSKNGNPDGTSSDGGLYASDGGLDPRDAESDGFTVLWARPVTPGCVAATATSVYWCDLAADNYTGAVFQVPIEGGGSWSILAPSMHVPVDLTIVGDTAYWADGATVMSAPLDGGSALTIATGPDPSSVAVGSGYVFWTDVMAGTVSAWSEEGGVFTVAQGQAQPESIAVSNGFVYWTNRGTGRSEMDDDDGTVMVKAISGATPVTLAEHQDAPGSIAVTASTAYWLTANAVVSVAAGGGTPMTMAMNSDMAPGISWPRALVLDESYAYWISSVISGGAQVSSIPLDGGSAYALARGPLSGYDMNEQPTCVGGVPWGLAVDSSYVFFTGRFNASCRPPWLARVDK
jgi:hypothetical protein